jgi:hypothetical protein
VGVDAGSEHAVEDVDAAVGVRRDLVRRGLGPARQRTHQRRGGHAHDEGRRLEHLGDTRERVWRRDGAAHVHGELAQLCEREASGHAAQLHGGRQQRAQSRDGAGVAVARRHHGRDRRRRRGRDAEECEGGAVVHLRAVLLREQPHERLEALAEAGLVVWVQRDPAQELERVHLRLHIQQRELCAHTTTAALSAQPAQHASVHDHLRVVCVEHHARAARIATGRV